MKSTFTPPFFDIVNSSFPKIDGGICVVTVFFTGVVGVLGRDESFDSGKSKFDTYAVPFSPIFGCSFFDNFGFSYRFNS